MRTEWLSAAVAAAATLAAPLSADEDRASWRAFVADHATGRITAVDLDAPDDRWSFEVTGPARLYPTSASQAIVAVQSDEDRVAFLRSGIALEGHGDHSDIEIGEPALIDGALTGPRPAHVVTHAGVTAINFDRGGYAAFLTEADILAGDLEGREFPQAAAHHGFAVPMGDYVLSSVASSEPVAEDELPPRVGLQAFAPDGSAAGEMQACTDLHGEAFSGGMLLAGCAEGVASAREGESGLDLGMLPYPADFPEASTGTLLGARAMQVFLGNYGDDAVVVIDPTVPPYFALVEFPYRRVDFILDPSRPQSAYVLTEDGTLHRLNMLSAEIEQSAQVTQPYSMDGHWSDPRPRLAVAGDRLVLTDPLQGALRVVDSQSLEVVDSIDVEGVPYNIAVVGGSGLAH